MTAELSAHFFFTNPAYRIASPGTLCKPTKVAAVNCQAVSPALTKAGASEYTGAASAKKNNSQPPKRSSEYGSYYLRNGGGALDSALTSYATRYTRCITRPRERERVLGGGTL